MNLKQIFGQNVKKYRKTSGFTQMKLAELIDVDQKHISFIESGNSFPSPNLISKIAEMLNVSPARLFEFEEPLDEKQLRKEILYIVENSSKEELAKIHSFASSAFITKKFN